MYGSMMNCFYNCNYSILSILLCNNFMSCSHPVGYNLNESNTYLMAQDFISLSGILSKGRFYLPVTPALNTTHFKIHVFCEYYYLTIGGCSTQV